MRKITDIKSVIFAVEDIHRGWNENSPAISCYYDISVEQTRSSLVDVSHPKEINYVWLLFVSATIRDLNCFTGFWYRRKFKKLLLHLKERVVDGGFTVNNTYGLLFFNKKLTNNGLRSFKSVLIIDLKDEPELPKLFHSSVGKVIVHKYNRFDFVEI